MILMSAFFVFITFSLNLFLMASIGYGLLGDLNVITQVALYFSCIFLWVYLVLGYSNEITRKCARVSIVIPWTIISLIVLPQFNKNPFDVLMIFFCTTFIWLMAIPGEKFTKTINKNNKNLLLPFE